MKKLISIIGQMFFRGLYVVLDPNDTSVTFGRNLWRDIEKRNVGDARVFMFFIPELDVYGFMLNPTLDKETQICEIQYSESSKTIGFETLCPTVSRIAMDYSLPHDKPSRLRVKRRRLKDGTFYYTVERPRKPH